MNFKKLKYSIISKKIVFFIRKIKVMLKFYLKYMARWILGRYKKEKRTTLPNTIQLPITYKCNFDCVMCGMRTMISNKDFSKEELKKILSDKLFSKVETVGVNGGEPFLLKDLSAYIGVIIDSLPKLKNIFIISNGYFTEEILEQSEIILDMCHKHGIKYNLSISVDGVGEMQNLMRGHKNAAERTTRTVDKIVENPRKYCDTFGTICTITKINVNHLSELESWSKVHSVKMSYNIATIHKRINNQYKYEDFSVFTDEYSQMLAAEFFYSKFLETYSEQYFARYYYTRYKKRIAMCGHKRKVVTLTPNGSISYCATYSEELGNAIERSAFDIFFDPQNLDYRDSYQCQLCESCSHYSDALEPREYLQILGTELKRLHQYYV